VPGLMDYDWLRFGVLGRPHGVSGELVLTPYNPTGSTLHQESLPVEVALGGPDPSHACQIVGCRPTPQGYLVRIRECTTRDAAAALVGKEVWLPRHGLAPLADAEFYVEDLVGCEVFSPAGHKLGAVAGILWNGAQDIMSVVDEDGHERLYPVVAEFVHDFDRPARRVIVDPHE
jgi:16S rRNA processing protein RimM